MSLALPVVGPFAGMMLYMAAGLFGLAQSPRVEEFIEYGVGGAIYFGPEYLLVAIPLFAFLTGRSLRAHIVAAMVAPLLMSLLLRSGWPALVLFRGEDWAPGGSLMILTLQVGYFYVCLALTGLWLGTRTGCLARETARCKS